MRALGFYVWGAGFCSLSRKALRRAEMGFEFRLWEHLGLLGLVVFGCFAKEAGLLGQK